MFECLLLAISVQVRLSEELYVVSDNSIETTPAGGAVCPRGDSAGPRKDSSESTQRVLPVGGARCTSPTTAELPAATFRTT